MSLRFLGRSRSGQAKAQNCSWVVVRAVNCVNSGPMREREANLAGSGGGGDLGSALAALREHVGELQPPQIAHGRRAIVLFDGLQGSAKQFALRQLTPAFDPCHCVVHPTAFDRREASEGHWLARFWRQLPSAGNTSIFFRSWYRRVLDDRVLGRTDEESI